MTGGFDSDVYTSEKESRRKRRPWDISTGEKGDIKTEEINNEENLSEQFSNKTPDTNINVESDAKSEIIEQEIIIEKDSSKNIEKESDKEIIVEEKEPSENIKTSPKPEKTTETIPENKSKSEKNNNSEIDNIQIVEFILGNIRFGINIKNIQGIERSIPASALPETDNYLTGVVNLRGQIIPLIDLRKRLEIDSDINYDNSKTMIVEIEEKLVGLIVDSIVGIVHAPINSIESMPAVDAFSIDRELIDGIVTIDDKLIVVLNHHGVA